MRDLGLTSYLCCCMARAKTLLKNDQFRLTLDRLCYEIIENYPAVNEKCIIGIQERGIFLAERIAERLTMLERGSKMNVGKLDITFYRDDYRIRTEPIKASETDIEFDIDGKDVILVDDVLFSGRTIHAAMAALQDFGRPSKIELLVMVDRRFNRHLPIQPNYTGIVVDAYDEAYVKVEYNHVEEEDKILLFSAKTAK